jgi:hypothetical protein
MEVVSKMIGHADTRITQEAYAELRDETAHLEVLKAWGA